MSGDRQYMFYKTIAECSEASSKEIPILRVVEASGTFLENMYCRSPDKGILTCNKGGDYNDKQKR